jgi:hypothetical protein
MKPENKTDEDSIELIHKIIKKYELDKRTDFKNPIKEDKTYGMEKEVFESLHPVTKIIEQLKWEQKEEEKLPKKVRKEIKINRLKESIRRSIIDLEKYTIELSELQNN